MSQATEDELVLAGDQLTVTKQLDRERFKHLGIVYEVQSARDDPMELRLIDTVPASVPVGFHPQYHGANWTMGDRTLVFERELDPREELVTLYGLGTGAIESVDAFRSEPTVEFRPVGETEFRRLGGADSGAGEAMNAQSEPVIESTSISDLARSLESGERDRGPDRPRQPANDLDRSGRQRIQVDDSELLPSLRDSIDQLEAILRVVSSDSDSDAAAVLGRKEARFHLEAILSHVAHLGEDLGIEAPSVEPESTSEPPDPDPSGTASSDPDHTDHDSTGTEPANVDGSGTIFSQIDETLAGLPRPGQGLPFFWLVALLGVTVLLLGFGVLGGPGSDLLLAGAGGLVALISAVGWLLPEEELPLPALPLVVTLGGLFVLAHPFLFGRPRSVPGLLTLAAGVVITTIPMAVENRRWQLLGLLET